MFNEKNKFMNDYGDEYDEEDEDEYDEEDEDRHQENIFNQQNAFGINVYNHRAKKMASRPAYA